ncbi:MAG: aminomethyltransferase family protein, partial [Anaerolineales bacterium]
EEERFMIITGSAFGTHDLSWIRLHLPEGNRAEVQDVGAAYACLGLFGPKARDIVQRVTGDDVSNAAFPYMTARRLTLGGVPSLALRVTYVGELGWEIYHSMQDGTRLWDALWEAGQLDGMLAAGYRAIDSLRLEKGYRYWSLDISPDYTPFEAGLGFAVKLDKGDFLGRSALVRQKAEGIRRKLCCMTLLDPAILAIGNEPIRRPGEDEVRSWVTSGGYGYAVGKSIAYAYLPIDLSAVGMTYDVEILGERVPAVVAAEPLWDPKNERIKA